MESGGLLVGTGGRFSSSFPVAKCICRSLCFSHPGFSPVSGTLGVFGRKASGWGTVRGFATGGGLTAGLIPVGFGEGGGLEETTGGLRTDSGIGGSLSVRDILRTFLINSGVSSPELDVSISA